MRILVANRGEIACRIIKSIKELGHESVAIFSTEDRDCEHVAQADYAVCVGPSDSKMSYLNVANILVTATELGVDAIHPGYGFLSENEEFVRNVEELGIKFIGPSSESISLMGNKLNALNTMKLANPHYNLNPFYEICNSEDLVKYNDLIGLPTILKYVNGGGGKGIRIVKSQDELQSMYEMVLNEARLVEANPKILIEKYIENAKHVEVQVISDRHGNVCHLGTRDCSIQRNGQKIIEEAPAVIVKSVADTLCELSVNVVKYIGYVGVGTLEFMVQGEDIFFLEMNTRLQVEHTVTEQVTNLDLVELQIKIADNEILPFVQKDVQIIGHSIECRINAENPKFNFAPSPGKLRTLKLPNNVRCDFGFIEGNVISPYYDSLIGKLIVTSENRDQALKDMLNALDETNIDHHTTIDFLKVVINNEKFVDNVQTTTFISENYDSLIESMEG